MDDISQVDPDQIEAILHPHEFSLQKKIATSFLFKYDFIFGVE